MRGLGTQVIVVQRLVAHAVEAHVGAGPMLGRPAGRIAAERTGALGWLLLELPLALHLVSGRVRVRLGLGLGSGFGFGLGLGLGLGSVSAPAARVANLNLEVCIPIASRATAHGEMRTMDCATSSSTTPG